MKTATSRKNGAAGYKALVRYSDGRTHIPHTRNFKTADEARAYAQKWIDANDAPKPSREEIEAKRNVRMDTFLAAWHKAGA
jgi:hypothetical protein